MRVYFAHAVCDKDSAYEGACIEQIKNIFGECEICNPFLDIKLEKEDEKKLKGGLVEYLQMMEKYFYPHIRNCDVLIAFRAGRDCGRWKGQYTDGVVREIRYANEIGVNVIML